MNRFAAVLFGGVVLEGLVGCSGGASGASDSAMPATASQALSGAQVTNIYLGVTNEVSLSETPVVAELRLVAGGVVGMEAATSDSSLLEFSVYRVRTDGDLEMVDPVWAPSGFSLSSFTADSTGIYLFAFPGRSATQAAIAISCTGGAACTNSREPGQTCVVDEDCDVGLSCAHTIGVCGEGTAPGVCFTAAPSCDLLQIPVCGCDGESYSTECVARAKGVGVASIGACATAAPTTEQG